ncbi:MAG: ComEC/Rec2 family competence protein [Candidatus Parcubacteria bacterium]|nr:ComEC/Rec2 family competence protein [Candidatus Parcubacteria bacterium]
MERYLRKISKILGSALLIIFLLIAFTAHSQNQRQNLEVDFLDVGQGDSILIKTPYQQNILIDGGPDNKVLSALGKNLAFYDKDIDLVVLTHPHTDHVIGLVEILRRYKVKKVLLTEVKNNSPPYLALLEEIKKQNIETDKADGPKDIVLGQDLDLKILYPLNDISQKNFENLNDSSIVAKLIYKNESFLFTGDAGLPVEQDLLASKVDLTANVLKVGHHGSKYSSSQEFLDAIKPQYAVIEVGANNSYGHPHLITVKRLEQDNIKIFRTDLNGTINFTSDGQSLKIKTEK